MTQATVGKWGNNLTVRLRGEKVKAAGLHAGECVEIEAQEDFIAIRRVEPPATLEAMFAVQRPEDWRAAYADAYAWGPDVGRYQPMSWDLGTPGPSLACCAIASPPL